MYLDRPTHQQLDNKFVVVAQVGSNFKLEFFAISLANRWLSCVVGVCLF